MENSAENAAREFVEEQEEIARVVLGPDFPGKLNDFEIMLLRSGLTEIASAFEKVSQCFKGPRRQQGFDQLLKIMKAVQHISVLTTVTDTHEQYFQSQRTKNAHKAAKEKLGPDVQKRRDIIKSTYRGALVDSEACAGAVKRKCLPKFKESGIKYYSNSTIRGDIRAILQELSQK